MALQSIRSVVVTAVVVAIATTASIHSLHELSADRAHAELRLFQLKSELNAINALEWRAIGAATISEDVDEQMLLARQRSTELLDSLGATGEADTRNLSELFGIYIGAIDREFGLVRSGKIEQAKEVDETIVDPAFDNLAGAILTEAAKQRREKDRARAYASFGETISLLLAAGIVGWLFARYHRAQKRAEEALLDQIERDKQLNQAQITAHLGSYDWRMDSDTVFWTDEHFRLWGLSPGSVTPDYRLFLNGVHPDDRERVDTQLKCAMRGKCDYDCEHRVLTADGTLRHIHGQGTFTFDEQGKPVRMVGTSLDITDRKSAETEIRRLNAELEERVVARTAELESANQQLIQAKSQAEAANRAKSTFLAHMSHEIRTPLNGVLGLARISERENLGRKTADTCHRIVEAGEQLLRVVNDILDLSKIEAGKLDCDSQPFRLAEAIEQTMALLAERAREKGLDLFLEQTPVAQAPTFVLGDRLRLGQILLNLLSNAVKFTENGEVRLIVERDGEQVRFRVRDTGIGIAPDVIARLFHPFEQADDSTSRKYGGTGLGLVISNRLAEVMGGSVSVTSAPGQGSEFVLQLPLPETSPVIEKKMPAASGLRLAGLRVLAADDVEPNRIVLDDLLQTEGALALFAVDGASAVRLFAEKGPLAFDIVLMDIQMPAMDGYEATRRIHDLAPDMPVIGLTAHAIAEERERCLAAGMVDHVTKPIDPDVLIAAMRAHAKPPQKAPIPREASAALIDREKLRERYSQRDAFITKLLAAAKQTLTPMAQKLRDAAAANNHDELRLLAHSVKGLAGNIEAAHPADLACRAEQSAREHAPDAPALARELADLTEVFVVDIGTILAEYTAPDWVI